MRPPKGGTRPFRPATLWGGTKVCLRTRTGCPAQFSLSNGVARCAQHFADKAAAGGPSSLWLATNQAPEPSRLPLRAGLSARP